MSAQRSPDSVFEIQSGREWILDVEYLVFSGGGMRGLSYLGVLHALDRLFRHHGRNLFDSLRGVSGSSAGALFGMLVCVGCRGEVLWKETMGAGFEHVISDSDIGSVMRTWGFNDKRRINERIRGILERYTGNPDITFRQLREQCGKQLVVTLSNVDRGEVAYHSDADTPDQPVWESVAASMSIPLIFAPQKIGDEYFCDGGFLDNLPMVFPIERTAAFQLSRPSRSGIPSFRVYVHKILYLTLSALERIRRERVPPEHADRIIRVVTPEGVNSWDFYISEETKNNVAASGARSMMVWWNAAPIEKHISRFLVQTLALLADSHSNITQSHRNHQKAG